MSERTVRAEGWTMFDQNAGHPVGSAPQIFGENTLITRGLRSRGLATISKLPDIFPPNWKESVPIFCSCIS